MVHIERSSNDNRKKEPTKDIRARVPVGLWTRFNMALSIANTTAQAVLVDAAERWIVDLEKSRGIKIEVPQPTEGARAVRGKLPPKEGGNRKQA